MSRYITVRIRCIAKQAGTDDTMWKGIWSVCLFEKSARLLVESPTTKALNLDVFVPRVFGILIKLIASESPPAGAGEGGFQVAGLTDLKKYVRLTTNKTKIKKKFS